MAAPNLRGLRKDAQGNLYFSIGGIVTTEFEREPRVIRTRRNVQVRRPTTTTGEEEGSPAQCADFEDRQDRERRIGVYEFQAFEAIETSWSASDWLVLGAVVLGTIAVGAAIVATGGAAAAPVVAIIGKAGFTSITFGAVTAGAATTAKIAGAAAATSWVASNLVDADEDEENYDVGNAIGDKWVERHPLSGWQDVGSEYEVQITASKPC